MRKNAAEGANFDPLLILYSKKIETIVVWCSLFAEIL
jgi:hypothetical protein